MSSSSQVPLVAPPVPTEAVVDERPRRDLSPDKRTRDLSPEKRPQTQTSGRDQEVMRLLKRAPRDPSPDKRPPAQLSNVTDEEVSTLFKTLTTYTLLIILMPILSYFGAKKQIFEDLLGYSSRESFIYWAILAVVSIHVVLVVMVYRAYKEGIAPVKGPRLVRTVKQD